MYSKAGYFDQAEQILADLLASLPTSTQPHHIDPTVFSIVMTGYNLHRQPDKTLITFDRIQCPDAISYLLAFQACALLKNLQKGKELAKKLEKLNIDLGKNFKLQTALFDMYGKCDDVPNAETIFEMIENPTIVHYNSLLKVYNNNKMYDKAFELYYKLKQNQKNLMSDQITFSCILYSVAKIAHSDRCQDILNDLNSSKIHLDQHPILQISLIHALGKCGDIITAQNVFDQITQERTTGIYNALMKGYIYAQTPLIALSIFDKIPKPDTISYLIAINACAQISMLRRARILYEQILSNFPSYKEDIRIMNALIDMFGKCADVNVAQQLFNMIEYKDIISYNALINAYGLNGYGLKALNIYNSLLMNSTLIPDEKTFSIILNACSHSLLVNEAEQIFDSIPTKSRNVFIYATMIDGLCRASKINPAENLLVQFEQTNRKYPPMYITLLTAYARAGNINKVIEIRDFIQEHFSTDFHYISSATILLANTYAFLDNMNEAKRLRTILTETNKLSGISKLPGISWTETNDGQIHEFIAHDKRHERTEDIYEELKYISDKLTKDGHKSDRRWITSDHNCSELADPLNTHSERLALAYQLLLRRTIPIMLIAHESCILQKKISMNQPHPKEFNFVLTQISPMTTLLEYLPDEILLTICQYLYQRYIIQAFCGLNYRLNCTISHFIRSFIVSNENFLTNEENVQLLSTIGPYLRSLTIKNISLSANEISLASNIRELTLIHTQPCLIPPLRNLTDLNIIYGPKFQSIDVLFLPNNNIHSVYISSISPLKVPVFSASKFSSIKQLTITLQSFDDFVQLLRICPQLTCLNLTLQTCDPITLEILENQLQIETSSTLRSFSLRTTYDLNVNFNTLKNIFKHLSSNIEHIAIEINTEDIACIDGELWENYLKQNLLDLHRFEFFILLRKENQDQTKLIPLEDIFKKFQSSYWSLMIPQNMTGYYNSSFSGISTCIHTEAIPTVKRRRYVLN
ncbi:unnamed protein product [Rotaria magnacalcarata]|uniref:Uncharacterized protein n=1 Tax=Rotaria magnacalcarata TaxID=392030 RepID=A0A815J0E9_9BILA|nr:unnamed protein product [Rotaria magnacalcarata]CAF1603388.1 unnamed protein product [Rotaria magnacalcarata]CAF2138880.1 unnamed protein product [Rotaria magnacalcarata]